MNLTILFSPICSFLQAAFVKLSQVDGKPGLSLDDFKQCVEYVLAARDRYKSVHNEKAGSLKNHWVSQWLLDEFEDNISPWIANTLVWIAYAFAKRKGYLS